MVYKLEHFERVQRGFDQVARGRDRARDPSFIPGSTAAVLKLQETCGDGRDGGDPGRGVNPESSNGTTLVFRFTTDPGTGEPLSP